MPSRPPGWMATYIHTCPLPKLTVPIPEDRRAEAVCLTCGAVVAADYVDGSEQRIQIRRL